MSRKNHKIDQLITPYLGREWEAEYLGYFDCFNRGLFFEAHEVLERLWLPARNGPEDKFYKGLIQLAGAFVHLQKKRLRPAAALFQLARTSLSPYGPVHRDLDVGDVLTTIQAWADELSSTDFLLNPLAQRTTPKLILAAPDRARKATLIP